MYGFCRGSLMRFFLTATVSVFFLFAALSCTGGHGGVVWAAVNRDADELYTSEEFESNLAVAQQMVESAKKNLSPLHPDLALCLNNLGALYVVHERNADAAPLLEQALAIRKKILTPFHSDLALSLNNLAEVYRAQGKYREAEPLYRQALAIHEKIYPPTHPDVALSLANFSELYRLQCQYREAESLCERALALREKNPDVSASDRAQSSNNLGKILVATGRTTLPQSIDSFAGGTRSRSSPDSKANKQSRRVVSSAGSLQRS